MTLGFLPSYFIFHFQGTYIVYQLLSEKLPVTSFLGLTIIRLRFEENKAERSP